MPPQDGQSDTPSAAQDSQHRPEAPTHDAVIKEFSEVEDDPARFRKGIAAYAPFVEGTHLPDVFRDFHEPCQEVSPSTFLFLIVGCLPTWFDKTKPNSSDSAEEKTQRSARTEADLVWLLELVRDYIKFTRSNIVPKDVEIIVPRITNFCQNAANKKEINHGIEILFESSKRVEISLDDLRKILAVLTATAKALSEVPKPLEIYLKFLMTGDMSEVCLDELEKLIAVPNRENATDGLTYARGACRLLGAAIDYRNKANTYTIHLPRFVDILYEAAVHEIFRFSRDILNACESIFASDSRRDELLAKDFPRMIAILVLCLKLRPPDGNDSPSSRHVPQSMLSISSAASASTKATIKEQIKKRLAQAKAVGRQLEAVWPQLVEGQKIEVNDFVLSHPTFNPQSLVLRCLDLISIEKLCWPGRPKWNARIECLEAHFVKYPLLFSEGRIKAIHILGEGTKTLESLSKEAKALAPVDATMRDNSEATQRVLRMFSDQVSQETNQSVFEALLFAIPSILAATGIEQESEFDVQETIPNLENHVLETAKAPIVAVQVTKCLVTIFRNSFHSRPAQALSAFQSLVNLAGPACRFQEARTEAMRLLLGIRSTSSGFVYLTNRTESEYVAVILCRTRASAAANDQGPKPQRHSASSSSSSPGSVPPQNPWLYDDEAEKAPKFLAPSAIITTNRLGAQQAEGHLRLDIGAWLTQAVTCLQTDPEWETYSYLLVHLGSQLSNVKLFRSSLGAIVKLRQVICEQIANESFKAPPMWTGLRKHDIALCLFNVLTPLIAYASIKDVEIDNVHFGKELVQAFMAGMNDVKFDGAFRGCVHALSVCSLEFPEQVGREYPRIIDNMTRMTSKSHWALHMLEFLSQVAILPEVHKNFSPQDRRNIFGICIAVLKDQRHEQMRQQEQQEQGGNLTVSQASRAMTPSKYSGLASRRPPYRAQMFEDVDVPLYASALAYHTMICWFLSLSLRDRPYHAGEMIKQLVWYNKHGEPVIDQQAEVFRDMMLRTTYSDLGETKPDPAFSMTPIDGDENDGGNSEERALEQTDGRIATASWLAGYSIVTLETAGHTGRTQITKRQASGTTYSTYQQSTRPIPPHQAPSTTAIIDDKLSIEMLPSHVMLQLQITAAPVGTEEQPIRLPSDEAMDRALRVFDLNATIDSHKAGVLFVGPGQTQQSDIMSNVTGTSDYEEFLSGLGSKVSLQPPCGLINPQGLRYPTDGEDTIAWCDRVTEMVFLVPTMMPLDAEDEYEWLRRWSNVGNSYVNIIFNRSGQAWQLDTLKSQFNYVNIVITPADWYNGPIDTAGRSIERYYQVQVLTKERFPNISPAADPKLVSAEQLPTLVRVLAISACVFSQAWEKKDQDTEFHSPWRDRLIAIKELKKKYGGDSGQQDRSYGAGGTGTASQSTSGAAASGRRTPVPREDPTTVHEANALISRLDFTRWMSSKATSDNRK